MDDLPVPTSSPPLTLLPPPPTPTLQLLQPNAEPSHLQIPIGKYKDKCGACVARRKTCPPTCPFRPFFLRRESHDFDLINMFFKPNVVLEKLQRCNGDEISKCKNNYRKIAVMLCSNSVDELSAELEKPKELEAKKHELIELNLYMAKIAFERLDRRSHQTSTGHKRKYEPCETPVPQPHQPTPTALQVGAVKREKNDLPDLNSN